MVPIWLEVAGLALGPRVPCMVRAVGLRPVPGEGTVYDLTDQCYHGQWLYGSPFGQTDIKIRSENIIQKLQEGQC